MMDKILLIFIGMGIVMFLMGWFFFSPDRRTKINWIGEPVVNGNDEVSMGVLRGIELGLRDDGIVVWKKKDE